MLRQRIIDELELERHGLRYHLREPEVFVPFPDGRHVFFYADAERTVQSIARIAPTDAEAYPRYEAYTNRIARVLNGFMLQPQPSLPDFAAAFAGPDGPDMLNCALFTSVGSYLERFFTSDYVKGPMAYGGMSGSAASPWTPGTAFSNSITPRPTLAAGLAAGRSRTAAWAGITEALSKAVLAAAAKSGSVPRFRKSSSVTDHAAGVVLDNGDEIAADVVLSNADPNATLLRLAPETAIPEPIRAQVENRHVLGSGAKINFALAELPDFTALPARRSAPSIVAAS